MICKNCRHWQKDKRYIRVQGVSFARCAKLPDKWVKDSRESFTGMIEQKFLTQETYKCSLFEER